MLTCPSLAPDRGGGAEPSATMGAGSPVGNGRLAIGRLGFQADQEELGEHRFNFLAGTGGRNVDAAAVGQVLDHVARGAGEIEDHLRSGGNLVQVLGQGFGVQRRSGHEQRGLGVSGLTVANEYKHELVIGLDFLR